MKKPLIVFTHGGGRLGNQLINMAHLYSFSLEYKNEFDIINMGFWPYSDLFCLTENNPVCFLSSSKKISSSYLLLNTIYSQTMNRNRRVLNQFLRLIHLYYKMAPGRQSIIKGEPPNYLKYLHGIEFQNLNLDSTDSVGLLKQKSCTALAGWPIRCWDLFRKNESAVREGLKFSKKYTDVAERYIANLRCKYDKVIGVFIRQGDYKSWFDGKYYFETSVYKKMMREAADFYAGEKVCFVIASDDLQSADEFKDMNGYLTTGSIAMGGHFVESLAELSLCDLIISPPSTFSIWAAFSEQKPILPLISEKQTFSVSDIVMNNFFDALQHPHLSNSIK